VSAGEGDTPKGPDESTKLPHWREPATGEIPRVVADLVGEEHARWSDAHVGDLTEDDTEVEPLPPREDETLRLEFPLFSQEQSGKSRDRAEPSRERRTVVVPPRDDRPAAQRLMEPSGLRTAAGTPNEDPVRGDVKEFEHGRPRVPSVADGRDVKGSEDLESESPSPRAPAEKRGSRGSNRQSPSGEVGRGSPPRRSKALSTVTGLLLAAVLLGALYLGVLATEIAVTLALIVGATEAYGMFRRGGAKPAVLVGLIAVVGAVLGGYFDGLPAVVGVMAAAVVISSAWYLFHVIHAPAVPGTTSTLFVVVWVGVLGTYASLIIRRADFGADGLGLLIGVIGCAAAADTFAYFGGSLLGSHQLAPRVSPTKSIEGFLVGAAASILVGALVLPHLHPFTVESGTLLGAVAAFLTPLGDLVESALKREVHVKDSSRLLPGHGGMLDRIDGILFVLPAAYYLFLVLHIH